MQDMFLGLNEVSWVGIQAITAGAGLIGLCFYTLYTRRMLASQEETRRASFTPVFSVASHAIVTAVAMQTDTDGNILTDEHGRAHRVEVANSFEITLTVSNIGQGPATGIRAWRQQVSAAFQTTGTSIYTPTQGAHFANVAPMQMKRDDTETFVWTPCQIATGHLFVIEGLDISQGKNQMQVVLSPEPTKGPKALLFDARMVHARGDSFGGRIVRIASRMAEISRRLGEISRSLE